MDYTKYFELCGYDEALLKEQSPRIDKAFQRAGITEADIVKGEERLNTYYPVELLGVRQILKCWMKEFVNLMLCRDEYEKVIYTEWPGVGAAMGQGAMIHYPEVYVATPISQTINIVYGAIFDKLGTILDVGEECGFPPGEAHCALWQTHLGSMVKGLIPFPDLMISSGWYCDIPC